MEVICTLCGLTVVLVFAVSGAQKVVERRALADAIHSWSPAFALRARATAAALLLLELTVPALAIIGRSQIALALATVLLVGFGAGSQLLARERGSRACLCFGVATSPPSDGRTMSRNVVLALLSLFGQFGGSAYGLATWTGAALVTVVVLMDDAHHFMQSKSEAIAGLRRIG
jgi:hypothetical protein